ncbi:amino acid ABC transporter substrate-binding protein (PAAT family) [Rhizobium sp. BK376]|nr:amino acid ABC transporter substrate-binding protein (PAAT family) [Rhizobium sp. BK376]
MTNGKQFISSAAPYATDLILGDKDHADAGTVQHNLAKRMKRLILAGVALCFSSYAAMAAQTLDLIAQRGAIRIGYIADEAPFSSKKKDGTPGGYTIDLCRKISDETKRSLPNIKREYVETTLADGFEAVKSGRIDLLCGALTVNLTRRETVDFSQPIFVTGASALLRKDSPDYLQILFLDSPSVRAVDARPTSNSSIGVRADTTTGTTLRGALGTGIPEARVADFATHEDGLKALEDHRIDAYFADRALLISLASRARNPTALEIGNRLFTHEPYAIALRRDDSAFRLLVDRALTDFYLSDDFPKLLKTYFGGEAGTLRAEIMMQSIPQ